MSSTTAQNLFQCFAKELGASSVSTIDATSEKSVEAHEEMLEQNLPELGLKPKLTLEEKAEKVQASVMEWFQIKGIKAGFPEQLKEQTTGVQLKKIQSVKGQAEQKKPGLQGRRLQQKLTLSV